jgi:hypothetical protein
MFGKVLDFFGWWRVYDFAHGFFSGDELLSPRATAHRSPQMPHFHP